MFLKLKMPLDAPGGIIGTLCAAGALSGMSVGEDPYNIAIMNSTSNNICDRCGIAIAFYPNKPGDTSSIVLGHWLHLDGENKDHVAVPKNAIRIPAHPDDIAREQIRVAGQPCAPMTTGSMWTHDLEVIRNKELRRDIDAIIQSVKNAPTSRERSLAITKLQEAVMWLGMDLKRLGETNPYPNSKDPSNTKIEPTADGLKL